MTPPESSLQAFPKGISIIGTGKLGSSLAVHLHRRGYRIRSVFNRSEKSCLKLAEKVECELTGEFPKDCGELGDLVFLTLPDDAIAGHVQKLIPILDDEIKPAWAHTSGAVMSEVLNPLKSNSGGIVSFHPVQTFNGHNEETAFKNTFVTLEGSEALCMELKSLVRALGARPLLVTPEQKKAIHLAAVFISNFYVALFSGARAILKEHKVDVRTRELFGPIAEQTLQSLLQHSPREVLTGPIARGDADSVKKHLEILNRMPDWDPVYREMSKAALRLAQEMPDRDQGKDKELENLL
ncbi:DUF2520 domain-containing protein [Balneolaceae bacterium ANBcel3]|nr:DUF2520 domain-containing protein [Balneolaceae bacterium ANBcel3]